MTATPRSTPNGCNRCAAAGFGAEAAQTVPHLTQRKSGSSWRIEAAKQV